MALPVISADVIHMGKSTYMWIQIVHFAIDTSKSDSTCLASLVASPGFAHDYASPYPSTHAELTSDAVHGQWWLSALSSDCYQPITAEQAKHDLERWANEQDWVVPEYRQPADAMDRLRTVHALLRTGTVYKLRNPGPDDGHDYAPVCITGFHEFAVINRDARQLHLIVASDD